MTRPSYERPIPPLITCTIDGCAAATVLMSATISLSLWYAESADGKSSGTATDGPTTVSAGATWKPSALIFLTSPYVAVMLTRPSSTPSTEAPVWATLLTSSKVCGPVTTNMPRVSSLTAPGAVPGVAINAASTATATNSADLRNLATDLAVGAISPPGV